MSNNNPKNQETINVERIEGYLSKNGNLDRAIDEEAAHGKDAVKRFLSPLLEKRDWHFLDKFADHIMAQHNDPNRRAIDDSINRSLNPDRERLTRNDPALTPEELERRGRVFDRLRQAGVFPPQTLEEKAADAAELAAARSSQKAAKTAQYYNGSDVEKLGTENAKFLSDLREKNSPLGVAFREAAAKDTSDKLMKALRTPGGSKSQGGSVSLGVAGALIAGGTTVAIGGSAKDAAKNAGVALVNVIPGVNVLTAPNADEASVRRDVTAVTVGTAAVGTVVGTPIVGAVTGLAGNLVSDEIRRGYARFVEGKTETVAPAAGETFVRGAVAAADKAIDAVKETLNTAVDHLAGGTPSSARVKNAKPVTKEESLKK